jgi:hypothetical protein
MRILPPSVVLLTVGAFLPLWSARAATSAHPRLSGLKKIAIGISADPDGDLDSQTLRADVESRLRSVGIHVDPKSRSHLNVIIGVSMIRTSQGARLGYAYSIHFNLTQQVYLAHNPTQLTDAVTWQSMALGTASEAELRRKCEQIIARRMDEFVSAYLEAAEDR